MGRRGVGGSIEEGEEKIERRARARDGGGG